MQISVLVEVKSGCSINVMKQINTIRMLIWSLVLFISLATAFVISPMLRSAALFFFSIFVSTLSSISSGISIGVYLFKYPSSPSARLEFFHVSLVMLLWIVTTGFMLGINETEFQSSGLLCFLLFFIYLIVLSMGVVEAQKRGVEKPWSKPVHELSLPPIALSRSIPAEQAETNNPSALDQASGSVGNRDVV